MKTDIIISGVGGQGNIFASLVISQYAMNTGHIVAGSETIGAAQRGGSVVSHIRISDKSIYAPLISRGQAELLIGMEVIEMLRHMRLLNPQGAYLLNFTRIPTVLNNMGLDSYPSDEGIGESVMIGKSIGQLTVTPYHQEDAAGDSLTLVKPEEARVVHIDDALQLDEMEISESVVKEAQAMPFDRSFSL